MKIMINKFRFHVPLGIASLLIKADKECNRLIGKRLIKALKAYKKENGSFNLVEIDEKDGNKIVITI